MKLKGEILLAAGVVGVFTAVAGALKGNSAGADLGLALFGDAGSSIVSTIGTIGGLVAGGALGAAATIVAIILGAAIFVSALALLSRLGAPVALP